MEYAMFDTEEYLKTRLEWFWKCRKSIMSQMASDKEREEYKKKMQATIDTNLSTYNDFKIEYCQYCYMPLAKDSVAYKHGHCGYSCQ